MSVSKIVGWEFEDEQDDQLRPVMTFEYVSPELASEWLTRVSPDQRPVRLQQVKLLEDCIRDGLWRPHADHMIFDWEGRLIQGQHRCLAIKRAGIGVWVWVVRNAPPETFDACDQSLRRAAADTLSHDGYSNSHIVAAAVNYMIRYEERTFEGEGRMPTFPFHRQVLNPEIRKFANQRPFIKEISKTTHWTIPFIPRSFTFAAFALFYDVDNNAAINFFEKFREGCDLSKGSPILALRSHFIAIGPADLKKDRASNDQYFLLTLKAWWYWRKNRTMAKLVSDRGRTLREVI